MSERFSIFAFVLVCFHYLLFHTVHKAYLALEQFFTFKQKKWRSLETVDISKEWFFSHLLLYIFGPHSVEFSSVTQLCPTLCNPMNCSMSGLPVYHQLPEFTQSHVHWVGDAIQPSHPLLFTSPSAFNPSQHQGLFKWVSSLHQVAKVLEFQLQHQSFQWTPRSNDVQWTSPLGQTGWISLQSKGLSRVFSNTTVQKHQFSALSFLYSPTLTSIHDYWKNHSLD